MERIVPGCERWRGAGTMAVGGERGCGGLAVAVGGERGGGGLAVGWRQFGANPGRGCPRFCQTKGDVHP
ncbi:hypothetical protein [Alicyclobacillus sp. ALC3]|uniref:hypothetical protein n=1 Tax=Alicyclobacillus sp. ALC3 TaxID=2796143 RepID=UPI002379077C|nr:hypothetical protein [Alicyclobacillus sp. ALC3]WDL98603.1 hypothetical protein JC200_08030 [Alicyclobacillus sp. ALC3]